MENIMETIIAYIQAQDLYTLISLGVLFTLLFVVVIYKVSQRPSTTFLEDIKDDNIYEDDVFDESYDNSSTAQNTYDAPTQTNEGASRMTWFIIDGVAISTFTLISYVLIFKNMWRDEHFLQIIAKSIGYNFVFYFALIKPTLFNTKPKK